MEEQKILQLARLVGQFGGFGGMVTVDRVDILPGSVGLFSGGQTEKCLRRDILGHGLYRITCPVTLRYRAVAGENAADTLEQFARWLQNRTCPAFGADSRLAAGKCHMAQACTDGCSLYELALTVEATVAR